MLYENAVPSMPVAFSGLVIVGGAALIEILKVAVPEAPSAVVAVSVTE